MEASAQITGVGRLTATGADHIEISVVVPCYNEQDNVVAVVESVTETMQAMAVNYEIIIVDDGSSDLTFTRASALARNDHRLKLVKLLRNYGQTGAMMAGFDHASGKLLVAMDGDGQNDAADIPRLIERLGEGYDVVSGWRKHRQDNRLLRVIPSAIANRLIGFISGVRLNDYGCSLKAYRSDVIKKVRLYGEMHRFIPIYTSWYGARVTELAVNHRPRLHGRSKYGINRVFKVLLDLMVVRFLERYLTKPIYVFGGFGLASMTASALAAGWMMWLKFFEGVSFILTPLPMLVAMLFTTGILAILMGLLAELLVRTYYEAQNKSVYMVAERVNLE